jgi:hypothetical protein
MLDSIREQGASFDPEVVSGMEAAYRAALQELGFSESDDAATRIAAKRIVEFAARGERDPERLKTATLEALRT